MDWLEHASLFGDPLLDAQNRQAIKTALAYPHMPEEPTEAMIKAMVYARLSGSLNEQAIQTYRALYAELSKPAAPDIVELLTERRKFRYAGDCKCGKCCLVPHEMLCSAIDEIGRLRAALEQHTNAHLQFKTQAPA